MTDTARPFIDQNNIPDGVLNEISRFYTIDFSVYGNFEAVKDQFRSKRLEYTEIHEENVEIPVPDSDTLEVTKIKGDLIKTFVARGRWDNEIKTVLLWQVNSSGIVFKPKN